MQNSSPRPTNTGLWVPEMEMGTDESVYEVLSETPPSETSLLVVSYRAGPDDWIEEWHRHVGTTPANFGFVHVGEIARSAAAPATGGPVAGGPAAGGSSGTAPPLLSAIGDPTDLTGLGIQISQYLEAWSGTDTQITVYFDSLTVLLQYAELNRAYRFLHVLSGRVGSVDGRAYYRLDPDAHDSQTISTIQNLVDDVVELP